MGRKPSLLLTALIAWGRAFAATPYIEADGVRNAAGLFPRGLPGSEIAQGSLFRITGSSLGPPSPVSARAYPLGTSLAGVTVTATPAGGASYQCLPVFVSDTRIEAVLPSNMPPGDATIRTIYNGAASNPAPVTISVRGPGLFSLLDTGYGPGQIFNKPPAQDLNALNNPSSPAEKATLLATGLGPNPGPDNVPPPGPVAQPVQAYIGNQSAAVVSITRQPDQGGVDAIVVQIPGGVPTGCFVPVQLRVGAAVSNVVTMAISDHGPCSDASNPFSAALRSGGTVGTVGIVHDAASLATGDGTLDQGFAVFQQQPGGNHAFDRLFSMPPLGSCTLYSGRGNLLRGDGVSVGQTAGAGAITLQGPPGSTALGHLFDPEAYFKLLYASGFGSPPSGTFPLTVGSYSMQSDGTGQVGAFQTTANLPGPPVWLGPAKLATIPRNQALIVSWTAPAGGQVIVSGGNYDLIRDASAVFVCAAASAAGGIPVPVEILSGIPPRRPFDPINRGVMHLGFFPAPVSFTARRLDFGAFLSPSGLTREVVFQ